MDNERHSAGSTVAAPRIDTDFIRREMRALADLANRIADEYADQISELTELYLDVLRNGGRLYFAGNGGSAADAQHVATEYVVRCVREDRPALPALALTTDSSLLTACANDLSFDEVFARQVEALCGADDLLVLHSTSGRSRNLVVAARAAREKGTRVAALLGQDGGPLKNIVDTAIVVPCTSTKRIQEVHIAIEHVVCSLVERELPLS